MSVLAQPISNRAATDLHATMKTRDLHVCKNCIDRHTDTQCSVSGCARVDVFGEEAPDELAFCRYTDDKLYCPTCIKRIYSEEVSVSAKVSRETGENASGVEEEAEEADEMEEKQEQEEEEEKEEEDSSGSDSEDSVDDLTVGDQSFVCDATRCHMSNVPLSITDRAKSRFHSTVYPQCLQVCKACVHRHKDKRCMGDGCLRSVTKLSMR